MKNVVRSHRTSPWTDKAENYLSLLGKMNS